MSSPSLQVRFFSNLYSYCWLFIHWISHILGASSGLGKATALLFAKNGYRLSLAGRNEKALREVAQECIASGGLAKEQVQLKAFVYYQYI
jgi:hypothetical protein